MRFTIATITALLAASVVAAPAPIASANPAAVLETEAAALEARDECKWNAAISQNWGEDGYTRYQVRFSTTKGGVDMCGTMNAGMASSQHQCAGVQNNYACYFNHAVNSWVVEVNEVSGISGWNAIQCEVHNAIRYGCDKLGCGTG